MNGWLPALALALPGCLGTPAVGDAIPGSQVELRPTFSAIDAVVLTPRCATAACHGGNNGVPLALGGAGGWASLVGIPSQQLPELAQVAPSDPASSYLLLKIRGTHAAAGGYGAPMPPDEALSDEEIAAILAWIQAGAPND